MTDVASVADFDLRQIVVSNSHVRPQRNHARSRTPCPPTTTTSAPCATPPPSSAQQSEPHARPRRPAWACASTSSAATRDAIQTLTNADGGALAHFYLGKAYLALDKYAEALTAYESAEKAGYNRDDVSLAKAEAMRYKGDPAGALKVLDNLSRRRRADGRVPVPARRDGRGPRRQPAARSSPCSSGPSRPTRPTPASCSAWPCENDRRGNDDFARQLYERAAKQFPTHVGTLAQPGPAVRGHRALRAGQAVLPADSRRRIPIHERARLYFKDADASRDMYYDEEARRRQDRLAQILSVPVTDFELSRPQPQLPAEDGHHDARRPDRRPPSRSCWPARTSAKRRSSKSARCCPPRAWSWASSPPTKWQDEPVVRARRR